MVVLIPPEVVEVCQLPHIKPVSSLAHSSLLAQVACSAEVIGSKKILAENIHAVDVEEELLNIQPLVDVVGAGNEKAEDKVGCQVTAEIDANDVAIDAAHRQSEPEEAEACFLIKQIEGKGTGVIASRRIFPGEIIMVEKPLICVSKTMFDDIEKTEMYIDKQILKMGSDKVNQFMSLTDCRNDEDLSTYIGRFYTNCMSYDGGAALFPVMARVNHSCVANSEFISMEDLGRMHLVANYVIEEGEEISINYMSMSGEGSDNWATRNKYLTDWYTFSCSCKACILKGPARLVDDKAREEIKELMSAGLENLDLDDLNCLVERLMGIQSKLSFILELHDTIYRKTVGILDKHQAAVRGLEIAIQVYGTDSKEASLWYERSDYDTLGRAEFHFTWT